MTIKYRHINTNRPGLFIGTVLAASYRLHPLRAELVRLKTPGIEDARLNKQALLDAYETQVLARAEVLRGAENIGKRRPGPIAESHMRRAAAEIEAEAETHPTVRRSVSAIEKQIAAMPRDVGHEAPASSAPAHSIASTSTRA